jgi:hypothetical protein
MYWKVVACTIGNIVATTVYINRYELTLQNLMLKSRWIHQVEF